MYRLWRREGLKVPQKPRKRRSLGTSANACHQRPAAHRDDVWCWDFVFDRTTSGGTLKWLSIVDEYTRECLALKVDRGITSEDVIDTLAELFAVRGAKERTVDGLWKLLGRLLDRFPPNECRNYIRHSGYATGI